MRYGLKWPEYAKQWDKMKIKKEREGEFARIAQKLIKLKDEYLPIEKATGVPWYMIAVIHLREADNNFKCGLAQGDPWNKRSRNLPICGPFNSFFESAVWALRHDGLSNQKDWRIEKLLYFNEVFNGAGYHMKGKPSPYIWGGTNIQQAGKYVSDGKYSSSVWDKQPGVAPILFAMAKLDPSIQFVRED